MLSRIVICAVGVMVGMASVRGADDTATNASVATNATKVAALRTVAEQGDAAAQNSLGDCYYTGDGINADKPEGVKWYRKAAEQGCTKAQISLGMCCFMGEGVAADNIEAYKWVLLAGASGSEQAVAARTALAGTITASQRAKAQALAQKWQQEFAQAHPAKK